MEWLKNATNARPRALLVYADSLYAARCARQLRRLGWEVHMAGSLEETFRLISLAPTAVVLEAKRLDDDGRLACARIRDEHPNVKVVILADDVSEQKNSLGESLVVSRRHGMEGLAEQLLGASYSQVV